MHAQCWHTESGDITHIIEKTMPEHIHVDQVSRQLCPQNLLSENGQN